MESIATTAWQRKGSSVIFDKECLKPLISGGAVVSLRQALAWRDSLPNSLPVPGTTILVSGLETVIETMAPQEGNKGRALGFVVWSGMICWMWTAGTRCLNKPG